MITTSSTTCAILTILTISAIDTRVRSCKASRALSRERRASERIPHLDMSESHPLV